MGPCYFYYTLMILKTSKIVSFVLYADDTNAFYFNSCIKNSSKTVQTELDKIVKWLSVQINYPLMHPKQKLCFLKKKQITEPTNIFENKQRYH